MCLIWVWVLFRIRRDNKRDVKVSMNKKEQYTKKKYIYASYANQSNAASFLKTTFAHSSSSVWYYTHNTIQYTCVTYVYIHARRTHMLTLWNVRYWDHPHTNSKLINYVSSLTKHIRCVCMFFVVFVFVWAHRIYTFAYIELWFSMFVLFSILWSRSNLQNFLCSNNVNDL